MAVNQLCEQLGLTALVENIAADDDVEATEIRGLLPPMKVDEIDGGHPIERGILVQKRLRERVIVARRNIRAVPLQNEARQAQATADLENQTPLDIDLVHSLRKHNSCRPKPTEIRPGRARNPAARGVAVRVRILLTIAKGFEPKTVRADGHVQQYSFVTRHERPPVNPGRTPSA